MLKYIREFAYRDTGTDVLTSHRHCQSNTYEIIQTWSNGGNFIINDMIYPIYNGALFLINAVDMHCSAPALGSKYIRSKLVISSEYVDELFNAANARVMIKKLFWNNGGGCFDLKENIELADKLFYEMVNLANKQDTKSQAMFGGKLLQLVSMCFDGELVDNDYQPEWLTSVLEYISEHITEQITIEQICEHAHFSKFYLCHAFKRATGMTVMQYVLNRRLSVAKKIMLNSSEPLSKIASYAGFSGFSYFSRVFSTKEGVTPSEYRKNAHKSC